MLTGLIITSFNIVSFVVLLCLWFRTLRKQPGSIKNKLETSTAISIVCYTNVLLLEAIYLLLLFLDNSDKRFEDTIEVLNKFAEYSSVIILIHFVLELQHVLIILDGKVSLNVQLRRLRWYKAFYVFSMVFCCSYSLIILAVFAIFKF